MHTYNHEKKKNFHRIVQQYLQTPPHAAKQACTHACIHSINIIITATANINIMTADFSESERSKFSEKPRKTEQNKPSQALDDVER